ncbi:MAG: hypothetical protein ABSH32_03065 [Bryobacteraceae bacterium]|jgi:uncharacterized protein (TIGR03437 family)
MRIPILSLVLSLAAAGAASAQIDVLTANYDNNRTSADLSEGLLNTNNVNPTQFGKLYAFPVDGQIYAQPLYVHAFNMPGKGILNVLYVATMHNSVYAFDADAASGTAPLWQVNLGATVNPLSFMSPGSTYTDIQPEIGILGTPVIDRAGSTIYVANETLQGGNMAFFLHALDLTTGSEKLNGPVEIVATVAGAGWVGYPEAVDGQLPFLPGEYIQRPGLLLANGSVYVAFGSHGDFQPWHGWIVAYNATDLPQQTAVFNATPSAQGASIWQGGRGMAADPNGDIYCVTANGTYDGLMSWGESVLHLTPTLNVADWFTPAQFGAWTDEDADFGANGPILVPGTNLLIAGGKAGLIALVDSTNMGHELTNNTGAVQTFQAVPVAGPAFAIFNAALWNRPDGPILYLWGNNDPVREFQMQNGTFNPVALAVNSSVALNTVPFRGMTVSSNAFVPGSGIFWATAQTTFTYFPTAGTLHAFDAMDVSHELWNSDMQGSRDAMGNFTKFANPTVANGKVFVPTDSQQVIVYGLLDVPGITSVVNAASLSASTVAPGELIAIFGNGLGPTAPLGLVLDSQGKVATSLGGLTVTFDGVAAPLLYLSEGQINAVAPFSLAGKSTTVMQIALPGGQSYSVTLPVSAAAPAIFTAGASGSGQGAILNHDLSVNSPANPAARGTSVCIYATGAGLLNPAVADGTVIQAPSLPMVAASVSVTIGGQPATVSYQGAAPGFVAGAIQINAKVPAGIAPGPAVPVTLSVGGTPGLNTVTLAVE